MPQGGKDRYDQISVQKMAIKVTNDQICDGTISKKLCHEEYYILMWKISCFYEKVHNFLHCAAICTNTNQHYYSKTKSS